MQSRVSHKALFPCNSLLLPPTPCLFQLYTSPTISFLPHNPCPAHNSPLSHSFLFHSRIPLPNNFTFPQLFAVCGQSHITILSPRVLFPTTFQFFCHFILLWFSVLIFVFFLFHNCLFIPKLFILMQKSPRAPLTLFSGRPVSPTTRFPCNETKQDCMILAHCRPLFHHVLCLPAAGGEV